MNHQANTPRRGQPIAPEYFRAIAESTVDWESWLSPSGELLWVNEAVERFTGYTPADCLKMDDYPLRLIVPEHRDRMAAHVEAAIVGSAGNNMEFQVLHRDGSRPYMAVSWQPMLNGDGQFLGARISVRDVTEKRIMREELRLQNEHLEQLVQERTAKIAQLEKHRLQMEKLAALGELAAGVAHEINNPLAGIRNVFALLKRNLPKNVKHYDKLELIDKEIERISAITHQMYQLYRPSYQKSAEFSIRQTIDETFALARPMSNKHKVVVESDYSKMEFEKVKLREGELKQVVLNLIHNAIQASASGQKVWVGIATTKNDLVIRVRDSGCGIRLDLIDKIFDPFFSTKTVQVGHGMGLGLSVSRGLIEAMQGTITVQSTAGQGTEFVVELPRRLSENPVGKQIGVRTDE